MAEYCQRLGDVLALRGAASFVTMEEVIACFDERSFDALINPRKAIMARFGVTL